jgi:hypothetical protein
VHERRSEHIACAGGRRYSPAPRGLRCRPARLDSRSAAARACSWK